MYQKNLLKFSLRILWIFYYLYPSIWKHIKKTEIQENFNIFSDLYIYTQQK